MLGSLSGGILNWLLSLLYTIPGILIGLVLHEFAHAWVADKLGDPTPRMNGRISLNPMAHLDPVGILMLLIAGFGWAKPVMTNPSRYKIKRNGFALVGLAGPLTNLLLTVLFVALFNVVYTPGFMENYAFLVNIILGAAMINAALFIFNLLPIPPLDGYNILKDLVLIRRMDPRALWNYERYGQIILIGFIVLSSLGRFNIIGGVAGWIVNGINYLINMIFR